MKNPQMTRGVVATADTAGIAGRRPATVARLLWPLPWPWVALPAALIWLVTSAQMAQTLNWVYIDWPALSGIPLGALVLSGPLVSTAAAYVSSSTWGPRTPFASPIAQRSGAATARAQLRVILPIWWFAYATAVGPFLVVGGSRATAHAPDAVHIGIAFVSFAFFLVIGYVIGALVPTRLSPLLAFSVAWLCVFTDAYTPSTYSNPWRVLLPAIGSEARIGVVVNAGAWAAKALFLVSTSLVLLWLASRRPTFGYSRANVAAAVVPLVVPVVLAIALVDAGMELYRRQLDVAPQCSAVSGIEICLEHGQSAVAEEANASVARILASVGGPPTSLRKVADQVLDPERLALPLGAVLPAEGLAIAPSTAWLRLAPDRPVDAGTVPVLAEYLAGRDACYLSAPAGGEQVAPGEERASILAAYLSTQGKDQAGPPPSRNFIAWYQREQDRVMRCDAPALPPEVSTG